MGQLNQIMIIVLVIIHLVYITMIRLKRHLNMPCLHGTEDNVIHTLIHQVYTINGWIKDGHMHLLELFNGFASYYKENDQRRKSTQLACSASSQFCKTTMIYLVFHVLFHIENPCTNEYQGLYHTK